MGRILHKCDKTGVEWTVRKLVENYNNKIISYENAVQRGFVWRQDRKSEFILSVVLEKPIPPLYVTKDVEGNYSAIDGKQRSYTLIKFLNNEFELAGLRQGIEIEEDDGTITDYDLNGKTFSELREEVQNAIKDSTLHLEVLNNPTEDAVCDYFYLLNNGAPLTAMTKSRNRARSRKEIKVLGSHALFKNALTKKAFEQYTNEDIVVKCWKILNDEEPSFDQKSIKETLVNVKLGQNDIDMLTQCFDRVLEVYKLIDDHRIARRIITRTHLISIMRVVWRSIQENISSEEFKEWIITFFAGGRSTTISPIYNSAARAGSSKKESIRKRLNELDKSYDGYFYFDHDEVEHQAS